MSLFWSEDSTVSLPSVFEHKPVSLRKNGIDTWRKKVQKEDRSLQVHVICPLRRGASVFWDVVIWVQLTGQAVSH